ERYYDAAPEPIALIDATGRVRALNRAARTAAPAGARRVMDLTPELRAADGVVFRLLREALQDRASSDIAPASRLGRAAGAEDAAVELTAWPCAQGLIAWRWRPAPRRVAAPLDQADTVAWFRADYEGRVVEANPQFCKWMDVSGAALASAPTLGEPAEPPSVSLSAVDIRLAFPEIARRLMRADTPFALARTRLRGAPNGPQMVSLMVAPLSNGAGVVGVAAPAARADAGLRNPDDIMLALDSVKSSRLFDDAPIGIALLSTDGVLLRVNPAADRFLAKAAEASDEEASPSRSLGVSNAVGRSLVELFAEDDRDEAVRRLATADEIGVYADFETAPAFEARLAVGAGTTEYYAQYYLTRISTDTKTLLVCYIIDASEQRALEERFRQSQKLQSIGELAGGVAHDFNNMLHVILSGAENLFSRHDRSDPDFEDIDFIFQNAHRARGLVSQLLDFSRQGTLRPVMVNLTERISNRMVFMLDRMVGEKIELRQELSEDLWFVKVDFEKFEQVLTNLVINARDAMPKGGSVTVRTRNESYTEPRRSPETIMPAGEYVCVEVQDTGCGIPLDKQDKIFEPFFTTKDVGKGTGLGLSMVYGIVKKTGGFIFLESTVGVGTTFSILLPRHEPDLIERLPSVSGEPEEEAIEEQVFREETSTFDQGVVEEEKVSSEAQAGQTDGDADERLALLAARLLSRGGAGAKPEEATSVENSARVAPGGRRGHVSLSALLRKEGAAASASVEPALAPPSPKPAAQIEPKSAPSPEAPTKQPALGRKQIILLVEDQEAVRAITAKRLRMCGYDVLEAECGEDALELLSDKDLVVDLLLSDVRMPSMDGPTLLREASQHRPELPTVFMTGYARGSFDAAIGGRTDFGFLEKPFSNKKLAEEVKKQLSR
nr:response regulator [Paracoccaceae bacterium]